MGKKEKAAVKVVLDTNILISSLLFKGELSQVVDLWKKGKIIPIFSRDTFDEFKTVLEYPKFSLTKHEMKVIIEEEVLPFFEVIEVADKIKRICRDADDDKFIGCAVSASANFIVTGDKDLLNIGRYKSVKILSASEFLRMTAGN
ncbi:MAG: putative toxin-antitoxin system toxin component, PIN family [Nitrospirae bacterium]|nr:putative toxin-antitoxin system toxin component, PIN family [Nitrospirota bacterium]